MKKLVLLICMALSSYVCSANEDRKIFKEPTFSIGGELGLQIADDDNYGYDYPKSTSYYIYGALGFTENLSFDLGYRGQEKYYAEATDIEINAMSIESGVRYDWSITEEIGTYIRGGLSFWEIQKDSSNQTLSGQGVSPFLGFGLGYNFNPNTNVSIGYQYTDEMGTTETGQYDNHMLTVGVRYIFHSDSSSKVTEAGTKTGESITNELSQSPVAKQTQPILTKSEFVLSNNDTRYGFASGSYSLQGQYHKTIQDVAYILSVNDFLKADIYGHTDSVGRAEYNLKLSLERAKAVANELIKAGVVENRIHLHAIGESQPIADNKTIDGRASNRRVVIELIPTVKREFSNE